MTQPILVVDDDASMRTFLEEALVDLGYPVTPAGSVEDALARLQETQFQAVLTDVRMQGRTGLELVRTLSERYPDLPVVVMTAYGTIESAVEAMRSGAFDFLTKPFELEVLALTLERAARHRSLREEVVRLRRAVASRGQRQMIGRSVAMERLQALLDRIQASEAPVLIRGETGTGKELVARAIHRDSPQAGGPLVVVNCAAMPSELLESELFGHEKGAFTGAHCAREGLFRQAEGGSILLDEIGELPLELQPKLLRVLQEACVRPVGGREEIPIRTRVLAATHQDLETRVQEGRFRQDLYFRLNVIPLALPPLRERGTDVLLLAEHFLASSPTAERKQIQDFSSGVREKLLTYRWPGNVRELENCVEAAAALARGRIIELEDLPEQVRHLPVPADRDLPREVHVPLPEGVGHRGLPTMAEVEERYIQEVLQAVEGNKTQAAEILGFDRKTLYRKLARYGLGTGAARPR